VIILFGWRMVDPLISFAICVFIAREIYKIVRQTVDTLLDAVPPGIDFMQVRNDLLAIPSVVQVNDLHIWQTGADQTLLSAHLKSGEAFPDHESILQAAQKMLIETYKINHATLQILPASAGEMINCSHCN